MRGFLGNSFHLSKVLILRLALFLFILIYTLVLYTNSVSADQFSWISTETPVVESSTKIPHIPASCNTVSKTIKGLPGTKEVCVSSYGSFNFVKYNETGSVYKGAVSYGFDRSIYQVDGICGGNYMDCHYIPEKDIMISRYYYLDSNFKTGFAIFKDFSRKITQTKDALGQITGYKFPLQTALPDFYISNANIKSYQSSENGQWIVAEVNNQGIVRINTESLSTKKFTNDYIPYNIGMDPGMEFSISNDGNWVAVTGVNVDGSIYNVSNSCGVDISSDSSMDNKNYTQCPNKYIRDIIGDRKNGLRFITQPKLSDDGGELSMYLANQDSSKNEIINLLAPGYNSPYKLDYLALGDSYSSGEGDTERNPANGKKYYRNWTDNEEDFSSGMPREKCHISPRSYPYILAEGMQLRGTNKWNTVACSGAEIWDVKSGGSSTYKGQGKGGDDWNKPRLEGFNGWSNLKTTALNELIPGRQKQIEFVKKYKPKAITLTMGGNDVDFGGKIKDCAVGSDILDNTCRWAVEGKGRSDLAKEMYSQYDELKSLYTGLYKASDKQTKVYVLGYPQFINGEKSASCSGSNIFRLNSEEREMVHESVTYFNNVIEQASLAAGVKYIDLESSLSGHRLCDSKERYVTGMAAWSTSENQESFHPNAKGNFAIAMSVWDQLDSKSLVEYDICPNSVEDVCPNPAATKETIHKPAYFQSTTTKNIQNHKLTNSTAVKSQATKLTDEKSLFQPGSTVNITLHSDPVDLGSRVVSFEGSLDALITIPGTVPAGFHTLVISGISYSGEPIELEQTILIHGSDSSDIDENNIPDIQQSCGPFLIDSGIDKDEDEIDDVCDLEIVKMSSQKRSSARNYDNSDSNNTEASNNAPQNDTKSSISSQSKDQSLSSNEYTKQSDNKDSEENNKKSSLFIIAALSVVGVMVIIGSVVIWLV